MNELRSLNSFVIVVTLFTGSWIIKFFYYLSMLNNNFKEIMNCKNYK